LTVQQALTGSGLDAREARLLLAEAAGFSQSSVIAFPERVLPPAVQNIFLEYIEKRKRGEPIAYIVGHQEFYGIDLAVNPAVLIPRPETELLVELALQRDFSSVVDLGTGSGAIALALKQQRRSSRVVAIEASAAALVVAQRNAVKNGLEIEFRHGCWFEPLAGERFDLIVSNPPYVAENDPHLAALGFEPRQALIAGPDGLDALREIARAAPDHLTPGGWLMLEHGQGQEGAVRALLKAAGLEEITTRPDLAGIPRVSGGRYGVGKR
jgi:release factor glutamine methyltransferase